MRTHKSAGNLIVAAGLLGTVLAGGCSPVQWQYSYEKGMRQALQQRRRVLVQFASTVSMDCQEMDAKVFSNSEVQQLMQKFVAVRLDTVLHQDLVKQFNVQTVPTFFVIRPDGQIVGSHVGTMDAEKFRMFLIKYSYN